MTAGASASSRAARAHDLPGARIGRGEQRAKPNADQKRVRARAPSQSRRTKTSARASALKGTDAHGQVHGPPRAPVGARAPCTASRPNRHRAGPKHHHQRERHDPPARDISWAAKNAGLAAEHVQQRQGYRQRGNRDRCTAARGSDTRPPSPRGAVDAATPVEPAPDTNATARASRAARARGRRQLADVLGGERTPSPPTVIARTRHQAEPGAGPDLEAVSRCVDQAEDDEQHAERAEDHAEHGGRDRLGWRVLA